MRIEMKKMLLLAIALAALGVGCGPDKQKACEGCSGNDLRDCETAYEECDNVKHCSPGDIRREWSERKCVQ